MLFVATRHLDATKTTQTHQNYHRGYPCSSLCQRSFTYTLVVAFTLICSCSPHCRLSRESIHNTSELELIPRTSPKGTWRRAYLSAYFDSTMILHAWNRRTNECLSTVTVYQLLCVQLSCWNIQSGWYGSLMWLQLASVSNTKPLLFCCDYTRVCIISVKKWLEGTSLPGVIERCRLLCRAALDAIRGAQVCPVAVLDRKFLIHTRKVPKTLKYALYWIVKPIHFIPANQLHQWIYHMSANIEEVFYIGPSLTPASPSGSAPGFVCLFCVCVLVSICISSCILPPCCTYYGLSCDI